MNKITPGNEFAKIYTCTHPSGKCGQVIAFKNMPTEEGEPYKVIIITQFDEVECRIDHSWQAKGKQKDFFEDYHEADAQIFFNHFINLLK